MYMTKKPDRRVREPVQVYLDAPDREILDRVAQATGLSRAEILRRGLRNFATEALADSSRDRSLRYLVGILGHQPDMPADLSERHDAYLAQADQAHERNSRLD